ncbi:hypothetical protein B0H13DRAFT_1880641 [Mycena leptocephala]|nr:hypothetical protein B0H13DRAFT_1880641 [Mycena leptocephala]
MYHVRSPSGPVVRAGLADTASGGADPEGIIDETRSWANFLGACNMATDWEEVVAENRRGCNCHGASRVQAAAPPPNPLAQRRLVERTIDSIDVHARAVGSLRFSEQYPRTVMSPGGPVRTRVMPPPHCLTFRSPTYLPAGARLGRFHSNMNSYDKRLAGELDFTALYPSSRLESGQPEQVGLKCEDASEASDRAEGSNNLLYLGSTSAANFNGSSIA